MTPTHDLTTTSTPIDQLRPHPDNPRNGDIEVIAESLATNGQYRPIVACTDGTIIAGNHTYAAALSLGWDHLDVVRLDIDPNSVEAHRIMVADNRTADLGRYDEAQLLELLRALDEEATLQGTGYDPGGLQQLERLVAAMNAGSMDVAAEWQGMPEFDPGEKIVSAFKLVVHFHTEQDADDFFAMIGRDKKALLYWPEPWSEQRVHTGKAGPHSVAAD